MHDVTHPQALDYEKARPAANTVSDVFPNSISNHSLGDTPVASERQQSPKDEVDRNGIAVTGGVGSDAANPGRSYVLAILRAAYRIARGKRRRIQTDLDLLVGIARAVESEIYDPAFAIERAVEHGLVAWPDVGVAP